MKSALHLRLYRLYLTVIHSNLLKFRPCHGLHFSRSVYTLTQLPDNNTGAGFSTAFPFACRSLPAVTVIQMGIPFLPVPLDSAPYFSTIILGVLTFATMCAGTTMERQELNLRFICMEKSALLKRPICKNHPEDHLFLLSLSSSESSFSMPSICKIKFLRSP